MCVCVYIYILIMYNPWTVSHMPIEEVKRMHSNTR